MASFIAVLAIFAVVSTVSADDYSLQSVEVDDHEVLGMTGVYVGLTAGEKFGVDVEFVSNVYADDATVQVTIEGDDFDLSAESDEFWVQPNELVRKMLWFELPDELEDKIVDNDVSIEVEIDGDSVYKNDLVLEVKRPSYKVDIKSISADQTVEAGQTLSVDVVLQNIGFNELDDIEVTASIPTLNVQKTVYFGDIVALECDENPSDDDVPYGEDTFDRFCDEDDEDSVHGTLSLKVPYDAAAGIYSLEIQVSGEDVTAKKAVQVEIENEFEKNVFKSGNTIYILNPTDSVKGYRLVPESPASITENLVFVSPGETAKIEFNPNSEGQYELDVSVFTTKGELVDTLTFSGQSGSKESSDSTSPVVILTVVLAIIFIVLLIVLIVLIGKKPEKSGEFGESYY